MALQYNATTTQIGAAFPKAYARIQDYHGDNKMVRYTVAVFASANARKGAQPVDFKMFEYPFVAGSDALAEGYKMLKLEPEFTGALDI